MLIKYKNVEIIAGAIYIDYVHLSVVFEENSKIGILTPPLYLGEFVTSEYLDQWGDDYPCIVELFEKTDVKTIPTNDSFIKSFGRAQMP